MARVSSRCCPALLGFGLALSAVGCRATSDARASDEGGISSPAPSASAAARDAVVAITVLREGNGPACAPGDRVALHYTASLLDGTQFASSREKGRPLELTIGERSVTKGMSQGITGMRVGEKRRLVVPPSLAFGDKGSSTFPPNSTIVYEVELLAIRPK
ncbi:MAG: FKBP-type peptidyl-prolyl cis-trans isomerase [Polyangiaceae bacterium]